MIDQQRKGRFLVTTQNSFNMLSKVPSLLDKADMINTKSPRRNTDDIIDGLTPLRPEVQLTVEDDSFFRNVPESVSQQKPALTPETAAGSSSKKSKQSK